MKQQRKPRTGFHLTHIKYVKYDVKRQNKTECLKNGIGHPLNCYKNLKWSNSRVQNVKKVIS